MFRDHVVQTAAEILTHKGRSGIHAVASENMIQKAADVEKTDIMAAITAKVEEIMAIGGRGFNRQPGPQRPGGAPQRPQLRGPAPSANGGPTCTNCGKKGHAISKCPSPMVNLDQRPCFQCGKPGHVKANCPELQHGIKAVDEVHADDAFCFVGAVGVKPRPRTL